MGTEVQSKMHLLRYHSTRDRNDNAGGGDWPLYHKSKAMKNGQYHDLFSTKQSSVAFPGHDKETLRQTILKHEAVFRHQLHELHRLYKKQMDLMNGIKTTSKLHSHYSMEAETVNDCELLESKHKKPKKVLIDLELPADEYIGSEEEHLHVSAVSCNQSLRSDCKGDSSKPNSYLRRSNGLTDLNEPVLFGKTSTSASVDIPIQTNGAACSKEDTQRWNLSANLHSAFKYLGKELPNFHRGKDGVMSNLYLQNGKNKNECLPYSPEYRRTSSYRNNLYRTVLQNSVTCEHAAVLPADRRNKRTIFGVEISDRDQNASVVASEAVGLQSDFANCKPLFVSSQSRQSSALSQFSTAKGHHCSDTSAYEPFAKHGQGNYFRGLENLKDAKSTKYVSADIISPNRYRNEAPYQQHFALNDLQRKHESPQGGLCWLRDMMLHKSEASCSELDLLQMSQFATVTEQRKSLSRCPSQDQGCEVGKSKVVGNSVKLELFEIDDSQMEEQPKAKDHGLNKGLVDQNTNFRYHIDLNICMTEEVEEAQLTPSSPKRDVNVSAEIDLEMDVVGAEIGATPELESPESTPKDKTTEEPHADHIRDAAEVLVAISSSRAHDLDLVWFAEIVSLYKDDIDNDEVQDLDEMDYFELMTLGLTETKVEEYSFEPRDQEEFKHENVFTKRPRRGQARRGKQSKDFQRDVLPGLVTLSRYEVKEDLQIIEGLVEASGGLTQRNGARGGRGRGRRSLGSSTTSPKATSEQPSTHASIVDEKSLMSWGKRTRRLRRRQRCSDLISNHCVED